MENKEEKVILIADYGRSGQGWLSYMLCYILNAKYIEPYDILRGRLYCTGLPYIINLTSGNLPGREKTKYSLIIKTHNYPADNFNLTDKVIFLTRDPRDVAVSAYYRRLASAKKINWKYWKGKIFLSLMTKFKLIDFILTAYQWKNHYQAWEHIKYHFVRYEDLSFNTKNTLKSILAYLGVEVSENLIKDAVEKFSFEKITGRKKGEENLQDSSFFRKGIVGDYKNEFSKLALKIFKFVCNKKAKKAGYNL